ncbi:sigma-70 family RNA polymerase sigma factor [Candidatus Poribacteria bacterium]|nr:sigma-70 family RNA polymerase sigma factor [Candidatus Poribacteria bacterium]
MERSESDDELIERCHRGDDVAFEALYRRYVGLVYTICYGMTSSVEDARDLCQETFLNAYRRLGTFEGRAAFKSWLRQIAVRLCLRHAERVAHSARIAEEPLVERVSPLRQPDEEMERQESNERLWQAIRSLPPDDRAVLLLREMEAMRYDEIADALGWSVEKVTTRLHRARAKLATQYKRLFASATWIDGRVP